jgi:hypothetical protein
LPDVHKEVLQRWTESSDENQTGRDLHPGSKKRLAVAWNVGRIVGEEHLMDTDPLNYERPSLFVPPSYEECVVASKGPRADYVASPLDVAMLIDWDDEDDD